MEKTSLLIKAFVSLLIIFLLNACTLGRQPLSAEQRKAINNSKQILGTRQKNIEIKEASRSYYSPAGGIAGAVIVNLIANSADDGNTKLIKPLQQHFTKGYFNQKMNKTLYKGLTTVKWLRLNESEITKYLDENQQVTYTNNFKQFGDSLIYINFSYQFPSLSPNELEVKASVYMFKKDNPRAQLIYQNRFKYYDLLQRQKTNQEYMNQWTENNAARFKTSMNKAIKILSNLIIKDIQDTETKPNKQQPQNILYKTSHQTLVGYLEGEIKNKAIIRTSEGVLVVVNLTEVKRPHNWRE